MTPECLWFILKHSSVHTNRISSIVNKELHRNGVFMIEYVHAIGTYLNMKKLYRANKFKVENEKVIISVFRKLNSRHIFINIYRHLLMSYYFICKINAKNQLKKI